MPRLSDAAPISKMLDDAVNDGRVPGIVAVLATRDRVDYVSAHGVRDTAVGTPMTTDTVFFAASMTKLVTAIALLQLVEQGHIRLDQPVGEVLPEFDDLMVLKGFVGNDPTLAPPRSSATVRHLMTHTSGLGYDTWNADLMRYEAITGLPNISAGSRRTFELPLTFDPGARFEYGTSSDWCGRLIEKVSGKPLDVYFRDHICRPLDMADTVVRPDPGQSDRLATVHRRDRIRGWTPARPTVAREPEFWAGGHCLYTTPHDFARLQRSLLCGGILDGTRILGDDAVASIMRNQIGALDVNDMYTQNPELSETLTFDAGTKWGFGLTIQPDGPASGRSPGSAGWAGVCNTWYWIDPAVGIAGAFYTQTLPFYDSGVKAVFDEFERAVYERHYGVSS